MRPMSDAAVGARSRPGDAERSAGCGIRLPPLLLALCFSSCSGSNGALRSHGAESARALGTSADPVCAVARALADAGHAPARIDRARGTLETAWEDTGRPLGRLDERPATLLVRYVVAVSPSTEGTLVLVRAEGRRCTDGVRGGRCEAVPSGVLVEPRQLNALGSRLARALPRRYSKR